MKLLIVTQKIDINDDLLGFFHNWVVKLAGCYQNIIVVALSVGEYHLPDNVRVFSLGKDRGLAKSSYLINFYRYILKERKNYDAVLVHMNREYVLLGGLIWKLWGQKVFLWYNHQQGNILSDLSGLLADKIFYTSPFSYFSKWVKAEIMPVGINTKIFIKDNQTEKAGNSVLALGRISPVKNLDVLIKAAKLLKDQNQKFIIDIIGAPTDAFYYQGLKKMVEDYNLTKEINFLKAIANRETPFAYNCHAIYVNLTNSGSLDKTIFEAMACELLVLVSNQSLAGKVDDQFIFEEGDAQGLAEQLKKLFSLNQTAKDEAGKKLRLFVQNYHSLNRLTEKITESIK